MALKGVRLLGNPQESEQRYFENIREPNMYPWQGCSSTNDDAGLLPASMSTVVRLLGQTARNNSAIGAKKLVQLFSWGKGGETAQGNSVDGAKRI